VNVRATVVTLLAMLAVAILLFHLLQRQLSGVWLSFPLHPEASATLRQTAEDQKTLAKLDPANAAAYRHRFERAHRFLKRLEILELNRQEIVRRHEYALLLLFAGILVLAGVSYLVRQSRYESRLERLQGFLRALATGKSNIQVGPPQKDTIGRIAAMIDETSRAMAKDRRRLEYLEHLSSWQEAARRHAHEIRTPLTAAQLELERLGRLIPAAAPERQAELEQAKASILEELDRLRRFTQEFTAFAKVGQPRLQQVDLKILAQEFRNTFAEAWPGMRLRFDSTAESFPVRADTEMVRQVLVNLCSNSALSLNGRAGVVTLSVAKNTGSVSLLVADNGPGIAPEILDRLFEPYTTTRKIGEGMGLGLAISRKILLDHQGDLELAETSSSGTTFRLVFPAVSKAG